MSMDDRQDSKSTKASAVLTGARSDDSSLFSLDKLRKAEESASRSPRASDRDDSGLIDLQALAASAPPAPTQSADASLFAASSASLFAVPTTSAPFESPLSAVAATSPDELPSKRRTKFAVLGGVGAVAVAAVAFLAMQSSGAPPPAATAALAPALTTAAPPPVAAPAPVPEAPQMAAVVPGQRAAAVEPPKVAVAAPAAKPAAAPVAHAAAPRAAAAAPAPAAPAKPAGPVCDLTCQMQRAVAKTK